MSFKNTLSEKPTTKPPFKEFQRIALNLLHSNSIETVNILKDIENHFEEFNKHIQDPNFVFSISDTLEPFYYRQFSNFRNLKEILNNKLKVDIQLHSYIFYIDTTTDTVIVENLNGNTYIFKISSPDDLHQTLMTYIEARCHILYSKPQGAEDLNEIAEYNCEDFFNNGFVIQ